MTRLALRFCLLLAIAGPLVLPATAGAAPAASQAAPGAGLALPLQDAPSLAYVPPGFSTSARQAIDAAKATHEMQSLHATHHPL
jgi:hypothetical protein